MNSIQMAGPWVTEHEVAVVTECMRNGWHNYDYVERFQQEFARYHGRRYGIMTPNCTTAIHLLLTALGIGCNDEVIVPECTWVGSSAGIRYRDAKTIFVDIDPAHWCIGLQSLERAISPKTKAIIAVDVFGNMPDMDALEAISKKHQIPLIEDAAEAVGSTYKGRRAGNFGMASVFSFHRTKTIVTGEGGMILLDDEKLYERCMFLRDHGRRPDGPAYYVYEITYKYMPFNLQAAMGYAQFQRIDEIVGRKRQMLQFYKAHLSSIGDILFNPEPEGGVNGAWITGMLIGKSYNMNKLEAIRRLDELGVPVRPFFYPLSSMPAYNEESVYRSRNAIAYDVCARGINLPGALTLDDGQIEQVCSAVRRLLL